MSNDLGIPYTEEQPFYFLSYNSNDKEIVSKYARILHSKGVPVWYDNGLVVGEEWQEKISDKIDTCRSVIMFLSGNTFSKKDSYVHTEFKMAYKIAHKPIFPILLDKIDDIRNDIPKKNWEWWSRINDMQCINAYDYPSVEGCVQKLIEALGHGTTDPTPANNGDSEKRDEIKASDISYRVKMTAEVYELEWSASIEEFVLWMVKNNVDNPYETVKALLLASRIFIDARMCSTPIYRIKDKEQLIEILEQLRFNEIFKGKSVYYRAMYKSAVKQYLKFVAKKASRL